MTTSNKKSILHTGNLSKARRNYRPLNLDSLESLPDSRYPESSTNPISPATISTEPEPEPDPFSLCLRLVTGYLAPYIGYLKATDPEAYEERIFKAAINLEAVHEQQAIDPDRPFLSFNSSCWETDLENQHDFRCSKSSCSHPSCRRNYTNRVIRSFCRMLCLPTPGRISWLKHSNPSEADILETRIQEAGLIHLSIRSKERHPLPYLRTRVNRILHKSFKARGFVFLHSENGIHFHFIGRTETRNKVDGWSIRPRGIRSSLHLRNSISYCLRSSVTKHNGKKLNLYTRKEQEK